MTFPDVSKFGFSALAAIAAASLATPAAAQGGCAREQLEKDAQDWVDAVEAGSPFEMELGEWVDYKENFKLGTMSGFFTKPRKVDWNLKVIDPMACKAFIEAVVLDEEKPMVLATQLTRGYFGVGPIENLVTSEGDWLFNAARTYEFASKEDWSPIPEAERATRKELIAAADAYLDLFNDPSVDVPWGTPCARLEGGIYTGKGEPTDSCNIGVPSGVELKARKYVVDPVIGAVDVFLKFGESELPDSHLFRIENGKIRYVHTVTNCKGEPNCGFPAVDWDNPPGPPEAE